MFKQTKRMEPTIPEMGKESKIRIAWRKEGSFYLQHRFLSEKKLENSRHYFRNTIILLVKTSYSLRKASAFPAVTGFSFGKLEISLKLF